MINSYTSPYFYYLEEIEEALIYQDYNTTTYIMNFYEECIDLNIRYHIIMLLFYYQHDNIEACLLLLKDLDYNLFIETY